MQKKALTVCCCTGVLAAFGVFLRWVQNQAGFEADTGLAVRGAVWPWIVATWLALAAVVLGVQCLRLKNLERTRWPETAEEAFRTHGAERILSVCFGALMALGGVLLLFTLPETETQRPLLRALGVLAVAAGVAFPAQPRAAEGTPGAALAVVPVALFSFWLIVSYKSNIINPTITAYAPEILALCGAIIGFFELAGFAFGRAKAVRAVFWSQFAAFLCLVTLADSRYAGLQCMFAAAAAMLLLRSWCVVMAARPMDEVPETPPES